MKENIKLFKESISSLQLKNQELQQTQQQQQHVPPMSKEDLDHMNALFGGLRDDNSRLASEIKRLTKQNSELLHSSQHFCTTEKLNAEPTSHICIHSLQETNRAQTQHHLQSEVSQHPQKL